MNYYSGTTPKWQIQTKSLEATSILERFVRLTWSDFVGLKNYLIADIMQVMNTVYFY